MNRKIVSVDLGYGYVKGVTITEENILKKVHFPSVCLEVYKEVLFTNNRYEAVINKDRYCIGDLGLLKGAERMHPSSYAINPDADKLIAVAMHQLLEDEECEITLLLGLPYAAYEENKIKQKEHNGFEKDFIDQTMDVEIKGVKKKFTIKEVKVYPQSVGAYFANIYNPDGTSKPNAAENISAIVFEVGYLTLDVVAFSGTKTAFNLETGFSIPSRGMSSIIMDLLVEIQAKEAGAQAYKSEDVEYALSEREGQLANTFGSIDLNPYLNKVVVRSALKIANDINSRFQAGAVNKYGHIVLSGGGSEVLYDAMKKHYSTIIKQEDAVFANAIGYLAMYNKATKKSV